MRLFYKHEKKDEGGGAREQWWWQKQRQDRGRGGGEKRGETLIQQVTVLIFRRFVVFPPSMIYWFVRKRARSVFEVKSGRGGEGEKIPGKYGLILPLLIVQTHKGKAHNRERRRAMHE